jgi:putative transport protein
VRRSGIEIAPSADLTLKFGDKLTIAAPKQEMPQIARLFGNDSKAVSATNFFPIAAGIVLGVLCGKINIVLGDGLTFSPGLTGGVLLVAIVLSGIGKTGPIMWTMSGNSNTLLRQLGLIMFLAGVGTSAGAHIVSTFEQHGALLFLIGGAITLVPMIIATIVAHFCFKMNILYLLGALTGGMTSTPGLAAADSMTKTNLPTVAYATVYPIALVLLIVVIQVLAMIC